MVKVRYILDFYTWVIHVIVLMNQSQEVNDFIFFYIFFTLEGEQNSSLRERGEREGERERERKRERATFALATLLDRNKTEI